MPVPKKRQVNTQLDIGFEITKTTKQSPDDQNDIYAIEGIVTVEGVIDKTGEKIDIGAFSEQIGKTVSLMVMHGGIRTIVGSGVLEQGDDNKILLKGRLYDDIEMARAIAKNKNDGVKFNLSLGGKRLEWAWEETEKNDIILVTKKLMVREVSITGEDQQAHQDAVVTKTIDEINKDNIEEDEMTPEQIQELINKTITSVNDANTSAEIAKALNELKTLPEEIAKAQKTVLEGATPSEEMTKLQGEVQTLTVTIEKMEDLIQELQGVPGAGESVNKAFALEEQEFNKYLRAVDSAEAKEILKAINTGSGSGGNLIPQLLANEIIKDVKEASPFLQDAKIYQGSRPEIDIPLRDAWTNYVESVAEGSGVATKGDITYSLLTIKAGKLQSEIEITDEMREDTDFDMIAEIRETNQEDFAEEISDRIVRGVISGAQNFEGFTTNTAVTTGALETETASVIGWDDLINLEMSLKMVDRKNAKYYVSRDALTKMKKFKDSQGRPLWMPSLVPGAPSTFNGYPVIECPDMDSVADNNYPILFANFSKFYAVYWRKGMETEMDRQASEGKDLHITRTRMGGKVRKVPAGKLLKVKAAA